MSRTEQSLPGGDLVQPKFPIATDSDRPGEARVHRRLSTLAPAIAGRLMTHHDTSLIHHIEGTDWGSSQLDSTNPDHTTYAARALALGAPLIHPFGNFYAVTMHPDRQAVQAVNKAKGRPLEQTASIVTSREGLRQLGEESVFNFNQLPEGLTPEKVLEMMDTLYRIGPFGFRGRAAEHVSTNHAHLTQEVTLTDGSKVPTVQIIAPGYDCPSNGLLTEAMSLAGVPYFAITSANLSRHRKGYQGSKDEPAHWRMQGISEEFGSSEFPFVLLGNPDEDAAVASYPDLDPMSTSVIGWHRDLPMQDGRPTVSIERHGSMPLERIISVLDGLGINAFIASGATKRLTLRTYPNRPAANL